MVPYLHILHWFQCAFSIDTCTLISNSCVSDTAALISMYYIPSEKIRSEGLSYGEMAVF